MCCVVFMSDANTFHTPDKYLIRSVDDTMLKHMQSKKYHNVCSLLDNQVTHVSYQYSFFWIHFPPIKNNTHNP